MNPLVRSEAIVLRATPYKEYDRILTLFSSQGLFKLFAKGRKKEYYIFAALTSPFTFAEFLYSPGRKDLHRLQEGSILSQNLQLRDKYETLQAAEEMACALLDSQWIGKPAPRLFNLFSLLLNALPLTEKPQSLTTVFYLKILAHEGLLQIDPSPKETFRYAGECYSYGEGGALFFSQKEEKLLADLVLSRSSKKIEEQIIEPPFQEKIATLFKQAFSDYPRTMASR